MKRYRIGIIGLGNMGMGYVHTLIASPRWEVAGLCDVSAERLRQAGALCPAATLTTDAEALLRDPRVDAVALLTLADHRPAQIRAALRHGKHIMAEKPIAPTVAEEDALLEEIERSGKIVSVNLFNRNAWYHKDIQAFIATGEIGALAAVIVSHQTPGIMPTEGHAPEGPPFHNCGMHYVDVARWYAGSEYDRWHAQGLRLWGWRDPWWVNAHGSFRNGIAFSITQSFAYGQLAKDRVIRSGLDAIGTLGVVRMWHDFHNVTVEYRGVTRTETVVKPYGGKKLDVLCAGFAASLDAGRNAGLPTARDSVIASRVSQAMLDQAAAGNPPSIGTPDEMQRILAHRATLPDRY